ncbi:DUF4142 domain-containing protein [Nocardioides sp. SYSU D00065]|uniref:DUF4142 domain-containing protein n=1 Tax=Nocardioides sp. SYSU D00065 TaxID=2817378 RepID=UPI001B318599|nr:DUF4142 domain-containing protein [Nocardioides sp. SYSU D00065]
MSRSTSRIRGAAAALALAAVVTTAPHAVAAPASTPTSPSARSAQAPSTQDLAYLDFAARSNLAEVALGRLAKRHAHSRAVRHFGHQMVRDHTRQYRALEAVAATVGVSLPTRPSRDQRKLARAWSRFDGLAFSCAYVPFQWGDHQLAIAMTEKEVMSGSDPAVTQAAAASLPVLLEHYEHATMLLRDLRRC